ncbi:fimbrial protein [Enterobacter roggenkampii]|uniref:fimbrial protein n=1 Tax=Enterobacter roggenkampii TaxID=1812935 RepID=UPI0013D5DA28|nr:fimbrial protein [Enterobacter roggenkampii]MDL0006068.1 type 1 fimbrial protein [Enterobacter roggenkampii]MED5758099.1 fimbrial protein [Enterobacter roggenkampii]
MKKITLLLLAGLLTQAHADEIAIQMRGNIIANTCSVNSASQNLTIDLGQAASSDFKDVGDTGEWKNFDLTLLKCPSTTTLATATFNGQADSAHPTKFASTGSSGGLALELADRLDRITIAPQASFSALVNQSDHTVDFPLAARYYATSMPVSAGTFSSVVQVTFTYQ